MEEIKKHGDFFEDLNYIHLEYLDNAQRAVYNAAYTKTVFIPGTEMAVTGTESGDILVFDRSLIIEGIGEQNEKRIIKIVTLNQKQTPIT